MPLRAEHSPGPFAAVLPEPRRPAAPGRLTHRLRGPPSAIQFALYDCTGCAVCVEMCPDDSLVMKPQQFSMENFNEHWEYSLNRVSIKGTLMDKNTVRGSQFRLSLTEFSGACSGCGETPYAKLLTKLFAGRMGSANSSSCSSVWGGSFGFSPSW